jgi:hypothetical protein
MTLPQRITHFLGQSIGSLLRVFRLPHRKLKLNPTLLEESSKMSKQTPSQDSPYDEFEAFREDALRAYKEAALSDAYMFGEYDGYEAFKRED